jgi:AcrR family transcriptional regulator
MVRRTTPTPRLPARPLRGSPEETRQRLIATAAEVFNTEGYEGTDSNRLARAAGYAPGTFYKHFKTKKELFLAVYAEWVAAEWAEIGATIAAGGGTEDLASSIVDVFLEHHRKWRGFRASLRALVTVDPEIRDFYRDQRRRQLELLAELRRTRSGPPPSRDEDALLLFTIERSADAVADGELDALGLGATAFRGLLVGLVSRRLEASMQL